MKEITIISPTYGEKTAFIDDEDLEFISRFRWGVKKDRKAFYAATKIKQKTVKMHQLLVACPEGYKIDHIDRNGLNNQRSNLRVCTNSENQRNRGMNITNTSGFKGVSLLSTGLFLASLTLNGRNIKFGTYTSAKEAALAYDEGVNKFHGEFAFLNFPKIHLMNI